MDAHHPQLEGYFRVPLVNLSAVEILAGALDGRLEEGTVVVSPDRGAAELAAAYAGRLGLETVVLDKRRTSGSEVEAAGLTGGEVDGRPTLWRDTRSSPRVGVAWRAVASCAVGRPSAVTCTTSEPVSPTARPVPAPS